VLSLLERPFVRFVIVGGINTALTLALFVAAEQFMSYHLAYTLSYVAGIAIAFFLNSRYVFHTPLSLDRALRFPLVYLVQYVYGAIVLAVMVERFAIHSFVAILTVVMTSIPLSFVLSRVLLKGRRNA
jgi:putative flippase GtrA